jgi:hypothetical protein
MTPVSGPGRFDSADEAILRDDGPQGAGSGRVDQAGPENGGEGGSVSRPVRADAGKRLHGQVIGRDVVVLSSSDSS